MSDRYRVIVSGLPKVFAENLAKSYLETGGTAVVEEDTPQSAETEEEIEKLISSQLSGQDDALQMGR